jgi:hypothetical protein
MRGRSFFFASAAVFGSSGRIFLPAIGNTDCNYQEELNGSEILGQTVAVEWAFVKGPRKTKKRRN